MMKEFAWNAFKNTGSIDTFLELKKLENIENQNMKIGSMEMNNMGINAVKNFNSMNESLEENKKM